MAYEVRTLEQFKKELTLTKEFRNGRTYLTATENERKIVNSAGDTEKEAAEWLVRHLHRQARQIEDLLVEADLLTLKEIDEVIRSDEERVVSKSKT